MESSKSIFNSKISSNRQILQILCNEFYETVKIIVNKYSEKQEERDIVNQEEVVVKSIYRDFCDDDIFRDFDLLFQDDFFIIQQLQQTKDGDVQGFHDSMKNIVQYLKQSKNQDKIKDICTKYKKKDKFEWIFRQSITKIDKYVPRLTTEECGKARKVLLKLITAILEFESNRV